MISGDLDSTTPPGDARIARARLGPSVRFVSIPNMGHGPSLYDPYYCAQEIVRRFIASPKVTLDTSCVRDIPEVRAVGVFPTTLADQPPAARLPVDHATTAEARLAALAAEAVGDALQTARYSAYSDARCGGDFCGLGLRGGRVIAASDLRHLELRDVAYSRDSAVSGTVSLTNNAFPTAPGVVKATVHVRLSGTATAEALTLRWDERKPRAYAAIDGRASSGHAIHETVPAP